MGLYDGYRLANSQQVKQYEGSVVPELVAVSQEMQKRYDISENNMDYTRRFKNSIVTRPEDRPAFDKMWADNYEGQLNTISKRKDLENTTRETSMLAQQLPQDYAAFAQNMQAEAAYKKDLQERYDKGDIKNKDNVGRLLELSKQQSGSIAIDPQTGRYAPNFRGYSPAKELDKNKFIDDALAHANPTIIGSKGTIFSKDGQWLIQEDNKTRRLTTDEIDKIANDAFKNSEDWKSYMNQEAMLGTFKNNYSKVSPETVNLKTVIGQKYRLDKNGNTVKNGKKPIIDPVTLQEALQDDLDKGLPLNKAVENYQKAQIIKQHEYDAKQYAHKYAINEVETGNHYKDNPYALKDYENKKENMMLQMASTMTLGGADIKDVQDFEKIKQETAGASKSALDSYSEWLKGIKDGKVKIDLGNGKVGYKDASGKVVDVSDDANAFRQQIAYGKEKEQHLSAVDEAAARAANFKVTPALKASAQKAYDKEMSFNTPAGSIATAGGNKEARAKRAYQNVIEATSEFKKYQEELKKRMTGTTVGSDLFGFMNEKTVDGISKNVEGLVSSLGLKNGAIPVQDKNGQQLTADQWDELKGNMRAIGVTYTGDPSSPMALVVRAFKDVKGKKISGEDMIVKLPSTNIQAIAEQGMDGTQKEYMRRASGLATSLNNTTRSFKADGVSIKANTEDPRGGWTVQVNGKEKTAYSFKDIFEFLDQNHK